MGSDKEVKEILLEEQRTAVHGNITFARATPEDVDMYHKIEVKDLIDEYLGLYYILYIYGQSSIRDLQILDLIAREIYEFRDKSVQRELEERLEKMNDGYNTAMEKCHKMELKDLIDAYISLNGSDVKDDMTMCAIRHEIWHLRSKSEQEEFKKRTNLTKG